MSILRAGIAGFVLTLWATPWAAPIAAHHSFDAMYDRSTSQVMTGAVTKVEWTNPHARFYIDVKDARGRVTNWNMELGSPNGLRRAGWNRNSLKVGDVVTVTVSLARDGSRLANAREVVLANGKKVFAATAGAS
jgi:hypothetical protein